MVQYVWNTGLPFWGLFITLALATLYVIPVGTVYAVANLNANVLTVLGEIVSGYLLKGKPLVLLIFKVRIHAFHLHKSGADRPTSFMHTLVLVKQCTTVLT